MKRRYAYNENDNYSLLKIDESFFRGYACFLKLQNIEKPLIVYNGEENICIKDNDYEWIEVYPTNGNFAITIMYDNKGNLIEWYFDIAREIGKDNGIPYEDDLYLDVVLTPSGEVILLDEDELKEAFNKREMTREEFENAYKEAEQLMNKLKNNKDKLKEYTDKYLKQMLGVSE